MRLILCIFNDDIPLNKIMRFYSLGAVELLYNTQKWLVYCEGWAGLWAQVSIKDTHTFNSSSSI